jgi:hypothetical protein
VTESNRIRNWATGAVIRPFFRRGYQVILPHNQRACSRTGVELAAKRIKLITGKCESMGA